MLLVIVKANLYGDNSFTTNGNFLVSNYGVKYNLLLTVNNIEILFKFKRETEKITFERIDRYELQYSREDKQNSQQTFRHIQNFPAHLPTNKNGRTSVILPIRQPSKRGSTTRNR